MFYRNGFLIFLFSLVPGGGHMYMGYMKRGFQLMAFFFAFFAITVTLDIAGIGVPLLLLIWFYNFFDTIHIRRALLQGLEPEDAGFVKISFEELNGYHVGIGFIIVGILVSLKTLENTLSRILTPELNYLLRQAQGFVPSLLLILGGLYLIQNYRNSK